MNKEEILNEIKKTKQHLADMEKMLKECEYERWKPEEGGLYYFLNTYETTDVNEFCSTEYADIMRYKTYNCFETKVQAEQEAEKILVRRMLEDIARRLNKGQKIDWDDEDQRKYFIRFNYWTYIIELDSSWKNKFQGVIYCLDKNFLDVTIQEIGEERLVKYLRGE